MLQSANVQKASVWPEPAYAMASESVRISGEYNDESGRSFEGIVLVCAVLPKEIDTGAFITQAMVNPCARLIELTVQEAVGVSQVVIAVPIEHKHLERLLCASSHYRELALSEPLSETDVTVRAFPLGNGRPGSIAHQLKQSVYTARRLL